MEQVWLENVWAMLDGDPSLLERVGTAGPVGLLPAVHPVGALATVSVAACTLAVAELGARRSGGAVPEVGVDRLEAAAAFRSEALLRAVGWTLPPVWDPLAGDYRAADGWVRLHTNYAAHRDAALRALDLPPDADAEAVARRVAELPAQEVQERVVSDGGCAAVLYTAQEWAAHPHGSAAAGQRPVTLLRSGPSRPAPSVRPGLSVSVDGEDLPLAGIRVLDLTRVIAGPVATRVLAAWGADVLRIDPPGFAEVPVLLPETTVGKRCAALDLRSAAGRDRFAELVGRADVVVHGLRPGAMDGLGLGAEELRRLNPEVCLAAVDAYGWAGPWASRRGFDSLVQFSCGIAAAGRSGSGRPVPLPAQALDHATGYLLAAGICRGLSGRFEGLPPAEVRAALVGTANLLTGEPDDPTRPATRPEELAAVLVERDTAWGPVLGVGPPGRIAGRPGRWVVPAGPLGRHEPRWTAG